MKMMLMNLIMMTSMLINMMKTPISLMAMLLVQTIMMIMVMNKMSLNSWFPMITFLMMIGGLLIIFMYMSSIASNEKFKIKFNIITFLVVMFFTEDLLMEIQINEKETLIMNSFNDLTMMYNKTFTLMMMMVMYLLITMLAINKVTKTFDGPLRSKTYE